MRDVFSKTVVDKRVSTSEGTFEQTGIEDGWADLVVVAQVSIRSSNERDIMYTGFPLVP
jgi:hypothetical protein